MCKYVSTCPECGDQRIIYYEVCHCDSDKDPEQYVCDYCYEKTVEKKRKHEKIGSYIYSDFRSINRYSPVEWEYSDDGYGNDMIYSRSFGTYKPLHIILETLLLDEKIEFESEIHKRDLTYLLHLLKRMDGVQRKYSGAVQYCSDYKSLADNYYEEIWPLKDEFKSRFTNFFTQFHPDLTFSYYDED